MLYCLLDCLTALCSARAELPQPPPSHLSKRPQIAVVLEGGGAKGFAHVGVLKVLEENHVPVDIIVGTSMGSIVGAAYASGRSIPEMEQLLSSTDWDNLFSEAADRREVWYRRKPGSAGEIFGETKFGIQDGQISFPSALVQGQKVEPLLQSLFSKVSEAIEFDQLPVRFRAVAADIETGEAVVLSRGSLALATRASMSVPAFFSPVQIGDRLLVDGGITNNLPVDVALAMGGDVIIAVECKDYLRSKDKLASPLAVTGQILDLLLERSTQNSLKLLRPQDLHIAIEMANHSSTSFGSAKEIMSVGEKTARAVAEKGSLKRLSLDREGYRLYAEKRTDGTEYRPKLEFVRVENAVGDQADRIEKRFADKIGEFVDREVISEEILGIHKTGEFSKVAYRLVEEEGKVGLVVNAEPKNWLKNYGRLGFSLEDDFDGQSGYSLAVDARANELNALGAYANVQLEAGRSPRAFLEFYQPLWHDGAVFVAPDISISRQNLPVRAQGEIVAEYLKQEATFSAKGGYSFGEFGELSSGWRWGQGDIERRIGPPALDRAEFDIGELFTFLDIDQLDNVDFPAKGYRFSARETISREDFGSTHDFERSALSASLPLTFGNSTFLLSAEGSFASSTIPADRYSTLGGQFDISGYNQGTLLASSFWIYRGSFYRRIAEGGSSLFPFGGYIGATVEFASLRSGIEAIPDNSSLVAGSVFLGADTPLLPIYLGFGHSDDQESAIYLNVGRLHGRRR